jgi:hypothetical protein
MQPDNRTTAAQSIAATAIRYPLLGDYILDERISAEAVVGLFARAYKGDSRRPDQPVAIILICGMLARGDTEGPELELLNDVLGGRADARKDKISAALKQAKRILKEHADDIEAYAELLDRLDAVDDELRPEPLDDNAVGDVLDEDVELETVEQSELHVAAA